MAVIRISGYPGSGKTTLSKRLAEALGYEYHYAGKIFRDMAKEKGISIEDFYKEIGSDPTAERSVDTRLQELMETRDNVLVEGRVAPFMPTPFKAVNILLIVDETEGARRALEREENRGRSLEEMTQQTRERLMVERDHYKKLYGIEDHFDPSHFDIVLDTTHLSPDEVFKTVTEKIPA